MLIILDKIQILQRRDVQTSSFTNNNGGLILKKEGIFLIIKYKI
ncbi:conserved domain protein [Streptococcus constellatus subsp. pharyngis SK1060 = CCUG 46377]|uniref:Conserved domain protein n=1 Tax=Streptococcus constellatus subsp. pharyngis SK1060 = CCUG 46377 TaxID=1035184 RepID=F9P9M8_STRCV|nr:conserved domain protein [Streptococcus constellatus subsp. pharyngis SK1060 = CCUG 46377]